jgi:primase-polymerase (primpol)-like protein
VITRETGILEPVAENVPLALTARRQWLVWSAEERSGTEELAKVPYHVETGMRTDANDSLSWATFESALEAYRSSEGYFSGIGFCLASCDPFVLIDLDNSRDVATGVLAPWAQRIIDRVPNAYLELSASQTGVHIILEAQMRAPSEARKTQWHVRGGKVEIFAHSRFVAITGAAP